MDLSNIGIETVFRFRQESEVCGIKDWITYTNELKIFVLIIISPLSESGF